jgi:hypothetical protein
MEISDDGHLEKIQALSAESHQLEAEVRHAILEQLKAQGSQVVGAREILDLAEAFAWVTNPAQAHGGRQ